MTSAFGPQAIPMMTQAENVGPGWHQLLRDLEEKLNAIDPDFVLMQVKEKFGGLRYYAQTTLHPEQFDQFHDAIREAEDKSFSTCEECGEPGETKAYRGWLKTLCHTHSEARNARIKKELDELHHEHEKGGEA